MTFFQLALACSFPWELLVFFVFDNTRGSVLKSCLSLVISLFSLSSLRHIHYIPSVYVLCCPCGSLSVLTLEPSHRPLHLIYAFNLILLLPSAQNPWLKFGCLMFTQLSTVWRKWECVRVSSISYIKWTHLFSKPSFSHFYVHYHFGSPHFASYPTHVLLKILFPFHCITCDFSITDLKILPKFFFKILTDVCSILCWGIRISSSGRSGVI